mmetsp:Transcript_67012/g.195945  ORF Transcript_67012/g.195945 Transcript_67012/m.195945 type:complete len:208 (-) Transcript_67012:2102-2725(-)
MLWATRESAECTTQRPPQAFGRRRPLLLRWPVEFPASSIPELPRPPPCAHRLAPPRSLLRLGRRGRCRPHWGRAANPRRHRRPRQTPPPPRHCLAPQAPRTWTAGSRQCRNRRLHACLPPARTPLSSPWLESACEPMRAWRRPSASSTPCISQRGEPRCSTAATPRLAAPASLHATGSRRGTPSRRWLSRAASCSWPRRTPPAPSKR